MKVSELKQLIREEIQNVMEVTPNYQKGLLLDLLKMSIGATYWGEKNQVDAVKWLKSQLQLIDPNINFQEELVKRYKTIGEFELIHTNYMKKNKVSSMNDKYGSPLYQLRHNLFGIKNIDNYLRKIITHNIIPSDIISYMDSLSKCINVYEFLHGVINREKLEGNSNNEKMLEMFDFDQLLAEIEYTNQMQ